MRQAPVLAMTHLVWGHGSWPHQWAWSHHALLRSSYNFPSTLQVASWLVTRQVWLWDSLTLMRGTRKGQVCQQSPPCKQRDPWLLGAYWAPVPLVPIATCPYPHPASVQPCPSALCPLLDWLGMHPSPIQPCTEQGIQSFCAATSPGCGQGSVYVPKFN